MLCVKPMLCQCLKPMLKQCWALSLFSSHRKNWFAARCEYLHLIKKNSQCSFAWCEFFLIRCKYSQRGANQFLPMTGKETFSSYRIYKIYKFCLHPAYVGHSLNCISIKTKYTSICKYTSIYVPNIYLKMYLNIPQNVPKCTLIYLKNIWRAKWDRAKL